MKINEQQLQSRKKLYFQWDTDNWAQSLELWKPFLENNETKKCLEIGGKIGSLSLLVSDFGHEVICSDLNNPKCIAEEFHSIHAFHPDLIQYESINALEIPYTEEFDIIIFKSVLGGIGRKGDLITSKQVVDQLYKALKPGGKILFAENLKGTFLHHVARNMLRKWGSTWHYFEKQELIKLFSNFSNIEYKTNGLIGLLSSRKENLNTKLAKIDKILNPFIPSSWKYIFYGVATK